MKIYGTKKVMSDYNYVRSLGGYLSGLHCEIWFDVELGEMWSNVISYNWEHRYHDKCIINMISYMYHYDRLHNIDFDSVPVNMRTLKWYAERAVEEYHNSGIAEDVETW